MLNLKPKNLIKIIFVLAISVGAICYTSFNNGGIFGARTDNFWSSYSTYIKTNLPTGYNILINGVNKYLNFGSVSGESGYGFRDNAGSIEYKDSGGAWAGFSAGSMTALPDTQIYVGNASNEATATSSVTVNSAGTLSASGGTSLKWTTAYGWGDHASLYDVLGQATSTLASHTSTYNHANYDIAYGWGDWNGNVDFSDDTNATAGTGISFTGDSIVFAPTEMSATTWGEGDLPSLTQVFDNSAANNPTWTYAGNSASLTNANLTVDTNVLFVDYTNDKVGIGTTTPDSPLEIYKDSPEANEVLFRVSTSDDSSRFSIDEDGDVNADSDLIVGGTATTSNLTVVTNSKLGIIEAGTWQGTAISTQYGGTGQDFSSSNGMLFLNAGSMSAEATSTVAGNGLTFTGTVLNFDGGDSPAGELGGTWASPTVDSGIFDDEYIKITDYNATTTIPATITTINSNTLEPMFSACIASTSEAFINTTNLPFPQIKSAYTITAIHCNVVGGTNYTITLTNGSNATESITCDADGSDDDGSITNASVTASEQMYLDFGTPSGAVNYLCFSIYGK